ncbi:phenylalanyl-trna synthetase subunit beta : Phenylalanine--tRNA ligase beta subunit OS=Anaerolinea thermophila (strain DSM 14523 / JCM 11388 / NBRC 100420 / UNI-1) GN=pheT PE=3 SV=1: tRNA_bind: B3_4: B5: FDX-ACB [Gemmata massiliana]|uniref:Phenylalanine--tRNA ligase beta subunit n=1 Tax=Gemmata massiliana TaxID=1210884 RepID=A0A6P2D205_9BACT|nr:phenylalanine--tRNA ligase subunit beta [Gemmata massiliana]VTR93430.1 phenylalanyl-trna synthetase subunit beta : Phenylalanine--tRNA ligase beta subunit OS=Anaerolinea thermophila (strain DSM 14523 / JCM 11388 / NBRC 100420 / UNI-1) GN=pheT PE=3 SV=1: tRNA_bind: B3_4: B5: FDX-ACB [Gemmata massiliana]
MLVPLSWLKDYVPLPADPGALVERLTIAGLESSGVKVFGFPVQGTLRVKPEDAGLVWERDKLVVAQVLEITKHPNADSLKLVKLDLGTGTPKTVITGAENIAVGQSGMKIILGLAGSQYFFTGKDGKKGVMTLVMKPLRGIDNDAMCMSDFELGIAEESEGIIILDDADATPGTPAQDVLGEIVVELDILPNMARCLSMIGIAREVAALTGVSATTAEPKVETVAESIEGKVRVEIADPKLCPRYTATVIRNVTLGPAPRWMRSRLHYAGMRPISNAVDITNYVMLEHGQPLHAFDYDVLVKRAGGKAPTIIVRPAKPGEVLKTLDGQDRELSPENLVIADTAGPIALAGVMGGAETEVSAATKTILLESACFDFVSVRKTARQFNLFSEASTRFSRGVHPEQSLPAAVRAAQLFHDHAGGQVLAGAVDEYPAPLPPQVIDLDQNEIRRLLGFDIPSAEVVRVLTALQFQVEPDGDDAWTVTTPPTRLDIQAGAADLIEELARVYGYDNLKERLLPLELPEPKGNPDLEGEDRVRDLLADQGLQEAITYSLSSLEAEAKLTPGESSPPDAFVALLNPLSPERGVLRRTLLPGLLAVAQKNLEAADSVAMYELGFVYLPVPGARLPREPRKLAVVLCGRRTGAAWDDPQGAVPARYDFYDLKGVMEALASDLHLPGVTFAATGTVPWLHPMRAAELRVNGTAVGAFGELHPKVAAQFLLGDRAVQVAELDLEAVLAAVPARYGYKPFSTFPPAKRDVAVVVADATPAEAVLAEIRAAGGELLTDAALFDVYRGTGLPDGTKSLAFALTYQAPDRTLGEKEIVKAHEKVEGRLRHVLKAQIRGKDLA